jgi:hypothetical protein
MDKRSHQTAFLLSKAVCSGGSAANSQECEGEKPQYAQFSFAISHLRAKPGDTLSSAF